MESAGCQHRFRHADQSPRRSIERLRPIGHVFLVCLIGAAEDATDHFVEHNESGVGENRFDLTSKNDQSGQSPLGIKLASAA
jgi:hypothetical protein